MRSPVLPVATTLLLLSNVLQAQVAAFPREKTFTALAGPTVVESVTFGPLAPGGGARLGTGWVGLFLLNVNYAYGAVSLGSVPRSDLNLNLSGVADGRYTVKVEFSNATFPITVTAGQSSCSIPQGIQKTICEFPLSISSGGNAVWWLLRMPSNLSAAKLDVGAITVSRFSY